MAGKLSKALKLVAVGAVMHLSAACSASSKPKPSNDALPVSDSRASIMKVLETDDDYYCPAEFPPSITEFEAFLEQFHHENPDAALTRHIPSLDALLYLRLHELQSKLEFTIKHIVNTFSDRSDPETYPYISSLLDLIVLYGRAIRIKKLCSPEPKSEEAPLLMSATQGLS